MPPDRRDVVLSPQAKADRNRIFRQGVALCGHDRADAYLADLLRAIATVAEYPELGRDRSDVSSGLRSLPVAEHVVYYRMRRESGIRITRILHARQDAMSAAGI